MSSSSAATPNNPATPATSSGFTLPKQRKTKGAISNDQELFDRLIKENRGRQLSKTELKSLVAFMADDTFEQFFTQAVGESKLLRIREELYIALPSFLIPLCGINCNEDADLLLLLRHSSSCNASDPFLKSLQLYESGGVCPLSSCAHGKALHAHIASCSNTDCEFENCARGKTLLKHSRTCSLERCKICVGFETYRSGLLTAKVNAYTKKNDVSFLRLMDEARQRRIEAKTNPAMKNNIFAIKSYRQSKEDEEFFSKLPEPSTTSSNAPRIEIPTYESIPRKRGVRRVRRVHAPRAQIDWDDIARMMFNNPWISDSDDDDYDEYNEEEEEEEENVVVPPPVLPQQKPQQQPTTVAKPTTIASDVDALAKSLVERVRGSDLATAKDFLESNGNNFSKALLALQRHVNELRQAQQDDLVRKESMHVYETEMAQNNERRKQLLAAEAIKQDLTRDSQFRDSVLLREVAFIKEHVNRIVDVVDATRKVIYDLLKTEAQAFKFFKAACIPFAKKRASEMTAQKLANQKKSISDLVQAEIDYWKKVMYIDPLPEGSRLPKAIADALDSEEAEVGENGQLIVPIDDD